MTGSKAPKFNARKNPATAGVATASVMAIGAVSGLLSPRVTRTAEARQDKDHQAHNLDKYVDENACERQTAAEDSHFGNEPRSNDVAANESNREQRIYRLANEPHANEGKRAGKQRRV